MNISELIPAIVEAVISGVEQCQEKGLAVFSPKEIVIEIPTEAGTFVKVTVPLFPHLRNGGQSK